jgi:hypothetical protein
MLHFAVSHYLVDGMPVEEPRLQVRVDFLVHQFDFHQLPLFVGGQREELVHSKTVARKKLGRTLQSSEDLLLYL